MSSHRLSPLSAPVSGVLRFLCLLCFALPLLAVSARAASAPAVATIARMQPGPVTTADTLQWRVTFTEAVTGVDPTDFALTQVDGSVTAGTVTVTAGGNAAEYLVEATGVTGIGTLRLDVKSSGTGIVNGASFALAGGFTLGQAYTHARGTVAVAWGNNESGQLGITNDGVHGVPALVLYTGALVGKTVVSVSAGPGHSVALCSDGTVAACGWGGYGQLGNGSTENSSTPVAVDMTGALAGKTVVSVAAGWGGSLALDREGKVYAWGTGDFGQLGNGATENSSTPVTVDMTGVLSGKTVVSVSVGMNHSLALCSDGTVVAWGGNEYGQLGNGSTEYTTRPVAVDMSGVLAGKTVVSVSAGQYHSVALCSDGTLAAWGWNNSGELGNGATSYFPTTRPVAVDMTGVLAGKTVVAVSAGQYHSVALCSDGTLAAWGINYFGQLGNDSTNSSPTPVSVKTDTGALAGKTVVSVSAGGGHSLALCSDGTVAAWGHNYYGQLGNDLTEDSTTPLPVRTGALVGRTVYALGSGYGTGHSLVLASAAKVITAVEPPTAGIYKAGDTLAFTLTTEAAVTVTGTPRLALTLGTETRYATYVSGSGTTRLVFTYTVAEGDTGDDWTVVVGTSVDLNGGTLTAVGDWPVALALPAYTLPVIKMDGPPSVATIVRVQPGPVTTADTLKWRVTFTEAVTGVDPTDFALTPVDGSATAGTVAVTAGANAAEYLVEATGVAGVGTLRLDVKSSGTGIVDGGRRALAGGFTRGQSYTHALGTELVAWGRNNTDEAAAQLPALVLHTGALAGKTVVSVSAGLNHSVALCSDGTLAAWGYNYYGQLGNGSAEDSSTPTPVPVDMTGALAGKTVVAVSVGGGYSVALCSDGTVVAWGLNNYGQLGNGSTTYLPASTPVPVDMTGVLSGKTVVAVSAGAGHSLALCSDGTVAAWGGNQDAQLGNGSTVASSAPMVVDMTGVLNGKTVVAVSAGASHSVALCSDGTVAAWGRNSQGELGNGATSYFPTARPVAVDMAGVLSGKTVVSVSVGSSHSLALCSDGTVAAWGGNAFGLLGNGSTESSSTPVSVDMTGVLAGKTVVSVSALDIHSLALCSDGTVAAWGNNYQGQLGNASPETVGSPVAVNTATGALASRTVYALGSGCGAGYSLVLASVAKAITAVEPPTAGTYKAGDTLTFTLTTEAAVTVTGTPRLALTIGTATRYATYASGSGTTSLVFTYTVSADDPDADRVAVGSTSVELNGGTLTAVGGWPVALALPAYTLPAIKVDGPPSVASIARIQPGPVTLENTLKWRVTFTQAVTGVDPADFALTQVDGSATAVTLTVTAGANAAEYLVSATGVAGVGTLRLDVKSSGTGIVNGDSHALAGGFTFGQSYTHALGMVPVAWGDNEYGQLGLGTTDGNAHSFPALVLRAGALADKTVVAVSSGESHSLALCSDGTVAAWGYNWDGQLGNGETTNYRESTPVPVLVSHTGALAGKTVVAVSAGADYSLALCSDGTVAAWGRNSHGELGNGETENSSTPVAVKTDTGALLGKTVVSVSAGGGHSLALCSDGTMAAWGFSGHGQLGNGDTTDLPTRTPVSVDMAGVLNGKTVVSVSAGQYHSLALCSDGTVAAWGWNNLGELGNGSTENSSTPVLVDMAGALNGKTVVSVSAGLSHSLALCSDGSVAAWGGNYSGELGNGRTDFFSSTPLSVDMTGVLSGKMVVSVSAGSSHSVALCSDGTVAAWGYNWDGQLGNGTTGYSTGTPMSVNTGTGALWGRTVYALGSDGVGGGCSLALASPAAIAAVEPPMDGGYTAGDTLTFTLTAGVAVTVTGTPRLALTIGTTTRYATYASGSGTTSLVFTYTVQDGERDSDGIAVASVIDLNGGTLTETETWRWPIRLALPAYTLPAIKVELRSLFAALSARAYAGAGEETLIVGFVFAGAGKPTLVRGVGPGMGEAVVGHLVDPQLRLYALDGTPVADNDDWAGSPELSEAFARTGAAALKADSKDAALLAALPGHVYTAHVSGLAGDAGVALAEAYDADLSDTDHRLTALSVRCRVGTDEDIVIAGFVITGEASKRVVVRSVGPGLSESVGGALADPALQVLKLNRATGDWMIVGENDDWYSTPATADLFESLGMGALTSGSKDAALVLTLEPGIYTAQMRGVDGATGVGLMELYEAQ
ncbi:MAG TPA: hypothetical protein PL015_08205 [Opitutaceae bacterium]|nr:hypothetical protein [Opitutaceae bacterium]